MNAPPGLRIKEADLSGHLENKDDDKKAKKGDKKGKGDKDEADNIPLVERDYQLYEALNVLKGLRIVSMRSK